MTSQTEIDFKSNLSMTHSLHKSSDNLIQESGVDPSKKRNYDAYMSDDSSNNEHDIDDENRGKKPGRKPMDEENEDEDEDPKVKRKAQNRAAQRAFRERRERHVKELEKKIKYTQDSHIHATTKLYKENQQLRAIIYEIESQLVALTGITIEMTSRPSTPLIEKKPGQSWLAAIGPPEPLSKINSFPSNPLPPLQIRPSTTMNNRAKKLIPVTITEQKPHNKTINESLVNNTHDNNNNNTPSTNNPKSLSTTDSKTNQQFKFAISTPHTLRTDKESDAFKKNKIIQAVQLYPNHSHPANCLLEKPKGQPFISIENDSMELSSLFQKYTSSVASSSNSVISSGGDEDEEPDKLKNYELNPDLLDFNGFSEDLYDMVNPFLDPNTNKLYMTV